MLLRMAPTLIKKDLGYVGCVLVYALSFQNLTSLFKHAAKENRAWLLLQLTSLAANTEIANIRIVREIRSKPASIYWDVSIST